MPEWLWSIVIGVVVIGLVVALRKTDLDRISKLEQWTKDKEKFDYEFRHNEYAPAITHINSDLLPLMKQVEILEGEQKKAEQWKHNVVDPYIPRAIDEHERRINRLDAKIFNGH